jgi:hypothetical protein
MRYLGHIRFIVCVAICSLVPIIGVAGEASEATMPLGRFQIVFSPHARADTFLVDTQTGQVWGYTKFTDVKGEPEAWISIPRLDSDAAVFTWARNQGFKANTPTYPTAHRTNLAKDEARQ